MSVALVYLITFEMDSSLPSTPRPRAACVFMGGRTEKKEKKEKEKEKIATLAARTRFDLGACQRSAASFFFASLFGLFFWRSAYMLIPSCIFRAIFCVWCACVPNGREGCSGVRFDLARRGAGGVARETQGGEKNRGAGAPHRAAPRGCWASRAGPSPAGGGGAVCVCVCLPL